MARKGWQYSFEADSERAEPADGDRPCGRAEWCSAAVRERQPDGTSRRVPARTYQAFCPADRDVIGRCLTAMPAAYVRLSIALGQQSAGEILVRMPFGPSVPVRTDADEIMRMLVDSVMTWRERVARVARLSAPDTQWWRRRALGRRAGALLPGSVPVLTAHLDALLALEPDVMVRPAMVPALGCGVTVAGWGDTAMVMAGGAEAGNEMMRLDYLSRACLGETNPLPEVLLGVACPECGQPKSLRRAAPPQHDGDPQWFAVCDRCRALLDDDEFRVHCRRLVRFYSHRVSPAVLASAGLRGDETVDIAAAAAA